ncbi:unnamed protein product [Urochloa humidicola]
MTMPAVLQDATTDLFDQWSDDDGEDLAEQMVRRQIHEVMNWQMLALMLGLDIETLVARLQQLHEEEEEGARGGFDAAVACLEKRTFHAIEERCGGVGNTDECAICFEDFDDGEEVSVMPCSRGHEFHVKCIGKWLVRSNTCPLCRHQLPTTGGVDGQ